MSRLLRCLLVSRPGLHKGCLVPAVIFVAARSIVLAQLVIHWGPVQQISFDPARAATPRVFVVGDTVHVFWAQIDSNGTKYIRSTDGGQTWSQPRNVYAGGVVNDGSTYDISVANQFIYVLWRSCDTCGGDPYTRWVTFRRSTDAGSTFEQYRRLYPGSPYSLTASDSHVVWLALPPLGGDNYLDVSSDYGETWVRHALQFRNYQLLHLVGTGLHLTEPPPGTLRLEVSHRLSTDLGASWSAPVVLSTIDSFLSGEPRTVGTADGRVFVVWRDGKYGTTDDFGGSILLRRSTDAGVTWEQETRLTGVPSGIAQRISVDGLQVAVVWSNEGQPFLGISARLSPDGGGTWTRELAVSDSGLQAGEPDVAIAGQTIYVVWVSGQVYMRRGNIITSSIASFAQLPSSVELYQNFPNPFNPSTTIRYGLPHSAQVTLAVYNTLGQQVAQLVNKQQQAGYHDVVFRGDRLASGVYFYRLDAGQFTSVKKLLLLK